MGLNANIPKECRQPGAGRTGLFAFPGWTKPRRPAREVERRGLMRKVSARIGGEGRGWTERGGISVSVGRFGT
jgi:hypothetical protein